MSEINGNSDETDDNSKNISGNVGKLKAAKVKWNGI